MSKARPKDAEPLHRRIPAAPKPPGPRQQKKLLKERLVFLEDQCRRKRAAVDMAVDDYACTVQEKVEVQQTLAHLSAKG